jgi:hypothetical protein
VYEVESSPAVGFGRIDEDGGLELRVRLALGLDSVPRDLGAFWGLVREEVERVTRPPALEVEGSGDVCGFG